MFRLDCETRQTVLASVCAAFGCSETELERFSSEPDIEPFFEKNWQRLPEFDRWLYQLACERFEAPTLPAEFCWFHCTRVPMGTTFAEGILPLGAWLPKPRTSGCIGPNRRRPCSGLG